MEFNSYFEVAASIFLIILLIDYLYKRQFPRNMTRIFLMFLVISFFASLVGVSSCIILNHASIVRISLKTILCVFYFFTQGIALFFFELFTSAASGNVYRYKWIEPVFFWVPAFVFCIAAISSPFTGIFFHFSETGQYRYGIAEECYFVLLVVFFLIHTYHLLRYGNKKNQYERFMILLLCLITLSCAGLEIAFPTTIFMGLSRSLCCVIIYLSLQNPNNLLDNATGLFNQDAFYLSIADRIEKKEPYSVILINISKFRFINKNFGYQNASGILSDLADCLKKICPTNDIYHIDSDEFALLVSGSEELNFIGAIKKRFEKPWFISNTAIMMHCRMIVMRYPEHFTSSTDYVPLVYYMRTLSKKSGDSSIITATAQDLEATKRYLYIEDAVKNALSSHQLCAFFQPIHSALDGCFHSAEVLARIPDEKLGFIPTQEFIMIAENNGLIVDLGYQIFEEACRYLQKLNQNGDSTAIGCLEVNISAIQCMQADLADRMIAIAKQYKVRPSQINFEITETAAIQSDFLLHSHMEKLHDKGFTFSIDDYGTGFANSSYLISYPFDQVKFDRGMILAYFRDDNAKLILDNEFHTIKALGKTIVAEGVESREQAEALARQGIDFFQGHFFSEPLTEDEFNHYLSSSI